jgi:putative DNA primase/helicase
MVTEQMLLVLHGEGANGKRTFVQAIEEVLGVYAESIPIETLLAQRFEGNAGPAELAKLDGARFVQCGENNAGRSLNEARIKILTGNDPVDARHLRGDPFSFDPQFKLLLHTNHRPKIRGQDKGIWRRVKLIPFAFTIPFGERDPQFFDHQLAGELEGILAWMVRGCLAWQRIGLAEPPTVTQATTDYRQAEDVVRQFAAEKLVRDAKGQELQKTLYDYFGHWCRENSIHAPISSRAFAERLREVTGCTSKEGNRGQVFMGIRVHIGPDARPDEQGAAPC